MIMQSDHFMTFHFKLKEQKNVRGQERTKGEREREREREKN